MDNNRDCSGQLIDAILKEGCESDSESFKEFVRQFYLSLGEGCIESPETLLEIARDVYDFLRRKDNDEQKLSIHNTDSGRGGSHPVLTTIKILNSDMPFLVDSFTESIKIAGHIIQYRVNSVFGIVRDNDGNLTHIYNLHDKKNKVNESLIYFAINKISQSAIDDLYKSIQHIYCIVRAAVSDWKNMVSSLDGAIENLDYAQTNSENKKEIQTFLEWLKRKNYIFLGSADYIWKRGSLHIDSNSLLGINKVVGVLHETALFEEYKFPVYITRSDNISKVHRVVHMDCIRLKIFNPKGKIIGERRFLGLFTSIVYYQDVRLIPIIREKVRAVEEMSHFVSGGHNHKGLISIMQGFPRGELFHISVDDLYKTCLGMLSLSVNPRFKLFLHIDKVGLFIRFIIFVPDKQFSMNLWGRMQKLLSTTFHGKILSEYIVIGDSGLVRLQLILKVISVENQISEKVLEKKLALIVCDWSDRLNDLLCEKLKNGEAGDIYRRYASYIDVLPESYKGVSDPITAFSDIKMLEGLSNSCDIGANLYVDCDYNLKVYVARDTLKLFDFLPVIENMAMKIIDHYSYRIKNCTKIFWIHHFILRPVQKIAFRLDEVKELFETAIIKALNKEIENDYYNSLIILAGLNWREVFLMRAFSNYLKQIHFDYSQGYIQNSLSKHPDAVALILKIFHTRFSERKSCSEGEAALKIIEEKLDIIRHKLDVILSDISNLIEDKIICAFAELCFAVVRTNYYLNKPYASFKIDSKKISIMPLPKPFIEIYVYSSLFEGIHLRGGKVARGGIRWSDRTEDFRTEVLGLMKAQMTKNVAIIPVGSKGGFVVKVVADDRDQHRKNGIKAYEDFLGGMLDLTDNIIDEDVIKPKGIVCYDGDDPYLVVAADKGTATFSNYANIISKQYNFWLSDAFASGGSSGYDHKKSGITARGALVSMKLRFWEVFGDIDRTPFSAVGIGDMSGDVFGNGMLLSDGIKLIAAFNHIHIFVDPDPDQKKSFKERERIFRMQYSAWTDYDTNLISSGGGVFSRTSKSIAITQEMKSALNIYDDTLSPNELIKYILRADVDIIWNGGIGTYVKSSLESNDAVGDKANDSVRVNGKDVRSKIIVEGGNLGCTQLGRIEYSKMGGCVNTDFIDNSGGVSCSDMEVNIKIAFSAPILQKKFTSEERDELLARMENDVCELILYRTSKLQSQLLTLETIFSKQNLEQYQLLLNKLEKSVSLDRSVEFLPDNKEILKMFAESRSFERPQIAVLIAYCKMHIYNEILASSLPDDSFLSHYLLDYFPVVMRDKYSQEILNHPLKREIIASCITNDIVNRIGCVFISGAEETGFSTIEVVSVVIAVYEAFKINELAASIDELIGVVDTKVFSMIYSEFRLFISQVVHWLLRNYPQPINILLVVSEFSAEIERIYDNLLDILDSESLEMYNKTLNKLADHNINDTLAKKIASLRFMVSAFAIIQTTNKLKFYSKIQLTSLTIGKLYFSVGSALYLTWLREIAKEKIEAGSYWQRLSIKTLCDELSDYQMLLTSDVSKYLGEAENCTAAIRSWKDANSNRVKKYEGFLKEIKASGDFDVSKLLILIKRLGMVIA